MKKVLRPRVVKNSEVVVLSRKTQDSLFKYLYVYTKI